MLGGKIRPGTTPTHIFNIPIDASYVEEVKIIYLQKNKEILLKRKEDCELVGSQIIVKLTQEETFVFTPGEKIKISLRLLINNGEVLSADPIIVSVDECLDREVLA